MSAPTLLALSGKSPGLPRHPQQLRGITHCDTGPYPVPATSGHCDAVLAASWQINDYTNGKCWALYFALGLTTIYKQAHRILYRFLSPGLLMIVWAFLVF